MSEQRNEGVFCGTQASPWVMYVQYTVEGAVQYGGRCSVRWRDIIGTVEDVQYCGGISSLRLRDIISTVEDFPNFCTSPGLLQLCIEKTFSVRFVSLNTIYNEGPFNLQNGVRKF